MRPSLTLILAGILATVGAASAAARFGAPVERIFGHGDIQVTLKPGQSYLVALPKTAYPGAPFGVTIADPSFNNQGAENAWIMNQVVSEAGGYLSWVATLSNSSVGSTYGGTAAPGQTVQMNSLCIDISKLECAAVLLAVPQSAGERVELSVPASSPFGEQTFVISSPET